MLKTKWQLRSPKTNFSDDLLALCKGDTLLARILLNRGVDSLAKARYFLDLDNIKEKTALDIPQLDKALNRVLEAINKKQKILIFGDYDVDGTTSVALLYRAFGIIGVLVDYYVPSRHHEGYGLNKSAITRFRKEMNIDLMITCDCGISNFEEVQYANKLGLDVIVTDHHSIPEVQPPSIANCNPKTISEEHPLHWLPGVGVAYKLAKGIIFSNMNDRREAQAYCDSLLDLVALGVIADLAPLQGENRYLALKGLKVLSKTKKPGLIKLMDQSGVSNQANSEHVGFGIAPRINAAGRLTDALKAVNLMITEDFSEAEELARELEEDNKVRQDMCTEIFDEAILKVEQEVDLQEDKVLVLAASNWNHGVIGIVASRLVERFNLPVFIMAIEDDITKGSVRGISIDELDIFEEMQIIQKQHNIFLKYGGHKMAAGFSVETKNLDKLIQVLKEHFVNLFVSTDLSKVIYVDTSLKLSEVSSSLLGRIETLAPYGMECPQPSFASLNLSIQSYKFLGRDKKHLKLFLLSEDISKPLEAVLWNRAEEFIFDMQNSVQMNVNLVYQIKMNEFRDETFMQLDIKDWKFSEEDIDNCVFARLR